MVHSGAPVSAPLSHYLVDCVFSSPVSLCPQLPPGLWGPFLCLAQLRFFRLARWWHWFHVFLKITLKYSFLLLIVVFGLVTVGYQLFDQRHDASVCKLSESCSLPKWHMNRFFPAFLSIFTILCGSWIEILWDCMEVSGLTMCLTFIVSVVVIGNLLVSLCGWRLEVLDPFQLHKSQFFMFNPLNVSDSFVLSLELVSTGSTVVRVQVLHLFLISLLNPYSSDIVALDERKKNNVEIAFGWCKTWILEKLCPSLGRKGTNKSDQTGFSSLLCSTNHHIKQVRCAQVQTLI